MIYQQKNGYYKYDFMLDGVRYARSTKTKDKKLANQIFRQVKRQAIQGQVKAPSSHRGMPLEDAVKKMDQDHWSDSRTTTRLEKCLKIISDKKGIEDIKTEDLRKIQNKLSQSGLTNATVNRYMATVKKMINTAQMEWGVQTAAPKIKALQEDNEREEILTEEQEQEILDHQVQNFTKTTYIEDLFVLLLDTGMRLSEAWNCQYHPENQTIYIPAAYNKTGTGRTIPLTGRAEDIVKRRYTEEGMQWGVKPDAGTRCLSSLLPGSMTAYNLRHTYGTRLVAAGVNLRTIQVLMGHSTIKMTQRYTKVSMNTLQEAVADLGKRYPATHKESDGPPEDF